MAPEWRRMGAPRCEADLDNELSKRLAKALKQIDQKRASNEVRLIKLVADDYARCLQKVFDDFAHDIEQASPIGRHSVHHHQLLARAGCAIAQTSLPPVTLAEALPLRPPVYTPGPCQKNFIYHFKRPIGPLR